MAETPPPPPNAHHATLEKHIDTARNALQKHKEKEAVLTDNVNNRHKDALDAKHPYASHAYFGYGSRKWKGEPLVGGRKKRRKRRTHRRKRRTHHRRKHRAHRRKRRTHHRRKHCAHRRKRRTHHRRR